MEGFMPNIADIGGWGLFVALCIAIVTMVVKGVLVPASVVKTMREEQNEAISLERERASSYQEAAENYQNIFQQQAAAQMIALQQQVDTNTRILEALQKLGEGSDDI